MVLRLIIILGLVGLFIFTTPNSINNPIKTCTEFIKYHPNWNLIYNRVVTASEVPELCMEQFSSFYKAHSSWDLSFAWEEFKLRKLHQFESVNDALRQGCNLIDLRTENNHTVITCIE